MKRHILCFALVLALSLMTAQTAFANAAPEEISGDTLAGAFTEPETIRDIPLPEALGVEQLPEAGGDLSTESIPELSDGNVTLKLYVYNSSTGKYGALTTKTLSWRDALAGMLNAEAGGFISAGASQAAVTASWTAQAVAIHTYLLYNNCTTNNATSEYYKAVDKSTTQGKLLYQAVDAALHKVVATGTGTSPQNYSLALTSYYASAGKNPDTGARGTANCKDVWVADLAYLRGVESPYDESWCNKMGLTWKYGNGYNYTRWEELITGVKSLYNIDLTSAKNNTDTSCLRVTGRNTYGYVTHTGLTVSGQKKDGQKIYTAFRGTAWTRSLSSGCYTVSYEPDVWFNESGLGKVNEPWHFVSYGNGHGVGMSQVGSLGYAAEKGWNAWQILAHYYPGTAVYDYAEGRIYALSETDGLVREEEPLPRERGDIVDAGDEAIDLRDLLALAGHLGGQRTLTGVEFRLADMNDDGKLGRADLQLLADKIAAAF